MTNEQKEQVEKAERAKKYFLGEENSANLYTAWFLVFTETKEYAEKVLNTPPAD